MRLRRKESQNRRESDQKIFAYQVNRFTRLVYRVFPVGTTMFKLFVLRADKNLTCVGWWITSGTSKWPRVK